MIPVFQRALTHSPERGEFGECLRACLASLFELALDDVPHFCDEREYDADKWYAAMQKWAAERGLSYIVFPVKAEEYKEFCESMRELNIDALHLLGGTCGASPHVVVAQFGACVHDPYPKLDSPWYGQIAPDSNGQYEFGMFAKRFI